MFAAPDPKDVEAQRVAQPAASYPMQTDPNVKTTVTTTTMNMQQPAGMQPGQGFPMQSGYQMQSGQPVVQGQGQQGGNSGTANLPKSTIARITATVHWGTLMLLIAFFSLVEMIAAAQVCDLGSTGSAQSPDFSGTNNNNNNVNCYGTRGYQVALGCISLVIAFIVGVMDHCGVFSIPIAQMLVSLFLFLWWLAGVIVNTFFGDFQNTSEAAGYFSTWFAFVATLLALASTSDTVEHGLDKTLQSVRKPLFFLMVASLVTMGASVGPCSPSTNCSGYQAYAVVASVVSAFIAIILFFLPTSLERKTMRTVAYLLVLWWILAAACLTLGNPFRVAGNGFFGCYAALVSSVWFAVVLTRNT